MAIPTTGVAGYMYSQQEPDPPAIGQPSEYTTISIGLSREADE
jgi:hypothetical protein